jgi:MerR family transcriptional regulator, light-induced transcriptional regulator
VIRSVLIQAMEQLPLQSAAQPPLVLLATLGNERHEIGLLMAESMFAQAGCDRLSLGTSMPLNEAVAACLAVKPDIFALSFSGQNAPREVLSQLKQLRGMLPPATEVWVGGSAVALRLVTDIAVARAFTSASDIRSAIDVWRASH